MTYNTSQKYFFETRMVYLKIDSYDGCNLEDSELYSAAGYIVATVQTTFAGAPLFPLLTTLSCIG